MQIQNDLRKKVAIITGGTGVLGFAIASGLAQAGVKVGILSRNKKKAENAVKEIQALQGIALPLIADVLDEVALRTVREKVLKQWGRIDILINCAGGNMPGATILPDQHIFDLSLDEFDKVSALNIKGTLLPVLIFAEVMAKQKKGSIINISSMAAQRPLTRVFGYSASKAAIENMTKWLAVELALKFGEGIRVNAIAPGFFIG